MGGGAITTGPFEVTRVESAAEPAMSDATAPIEVPPHASLLGRYSLLRKLGEGGMGVVYSAYDEELDRRVAIKLMRSREGGERGSSRMLREAQAMARLSHPNVVQVYDVGLIGGQLFVAMEFVQGQSLREWAGLGEDAGARALRPWREVVAMYAQAGEGLAAAHAAGIVHRDFKPDNVLVGVDGGARVVDFGLAARADGSDEDSRNARPRPPAELTDSVRGESVRLRSYDLQRTAAGTLIGTPAYMSPEQHLRQATDARSDQFSFSVALYEAIHGERPFAGHTLGDLATAVLSGRIREPPPGRKVPGWLRRAVLRGLAIAPEDRHSDMAALLAALAADPARRRAGWLAGIGVTALASLTIATALQQPEAAATPVCQGAEARISQVWGPERARAVEAALLATGRVYAAETWSKVHEHIDMYVKAWSSSYVDACEATWVRREQSDELLDLRMACLGDGLAELDALLAVLAEADAAVAERAVRAAAELRPLRRCDDVRSLRAPGAAPPEVAEAVQKVRSELAQVRAMESAGLYQRGRARATLAVAAAEASGHAPAVVEALVARGRLEEQLAEYEAASATLVDAYARAEAAGHTAAKAESATLLLRVTGERRARDDDAALWARLAAAVLDHLGWPVEARIEHLAALGAWHTRFGRQAEALAALDEVLALETGLPAVRPNQSLLRRYRGNALFRLGRLKDARAEYERAIELAVRSFGPEHPEVAKAIGNLGEVLRVMGELDAAEINFRRAATLTERALGAEHPLMAPPLSGLATIAYGRGDLDAAIREFRRIAAVLERTPGSDLAFVLGNIGEVELKQKKYEEAQATLERALALFREGLGIDHPLVFDVRTNLADVLVARGRADEAAAEYDAAIAAIERAHGPEHPDLARPLAGRARLALARRAPAAAAPLFERALALRTTSGGDPRDLAELRLGLADALWDGKIDRARARALVEEARQALTAAGADEKTLAAEAWLASHTLK